MVRLRAWLANLANENLNSAEGDPVPVQNLAGVGAPACVVDVELAATTLGHPAHSVSVEDITIRVTRPGGAGLRHNDHHVKPSTKLENGGSVMGLRPGGGLRPVVITRRYGKSCNVRQE